MFSFSLLKNLPAQLIACVVMGALLGDYLPLSAISVFYTISIVIKDILMFVLPLVVFSYLLAALTSFEKRAPLLILALLSLVVLSNGLTVMTSYFIGGALLPPLVSGQITALGESQTLVQPLFTLPFKNPIGADWAMMAAMALGMASIFFQFKGVKATAIKLRDFSTGLLRKGFIPVIPFYVLGFVLKLNLEGNFGVLLRQYGSVFALSSVIIVAYIGFMYLAGADFNFKRAYGFIREMIPAGITAFSTMSSAATMPITLEATSKNLGSRDYADFSIPTTVNIHLIGDGLNIALTALALLIMTGQPFPDFQSYALFTLYYCLAKFSCAAVPGGGVIVILPVVQTYLGLSPEATSLLATLYILQDPLLTSANVMGNGAFSILTRKWLQRWI